MYDGPIVSWPRQNPYSRNRVRGQANHRKEDTMLVRRLLFETRIGEAFLAFLERQMGLAVVQVEWLATQRSGQPAGVAEAR